MAVLRRGDDSPPLALDAGTAGDGTGFPADLQPCPTLRPTGRAEGGPMRLNPHPTRSAAQCAGRCGGVSSAPTIGSASCRERGCQDVSIWVVADSIKNKTKTTNR